MLNETDLEEFYDLLEAQKLLLEKAKKDGVLNKQVEIIKQSIKLQRMMWELFKS